VISVRFGSCLDLVLVKGLVPKRGYEMMVVIVFREGRVLCVRVR